MAARGRGMSAPGATATLPVVRALLDQARALGYEGGVLGVRARPVWDGPATFDVAGTPVRVRACASVLAVREALLDRDPSSWLVLVTERSDAELGAGVRARFVWQRLRTPDPWDAVRARFRAATLDVALTSGPQQRELAAGLLAATPAQGEWPPAPGGVLTRDHALRCVAAAHLGLGGPGVDLGATAVLGWCSEPQSPGRVADLRALAGDVLVEALLPWVAAWSATAAPAVHELLVAGRLTDVVPLGLAVGVVDQLGRSDAPSARVALTRLEPTFGVGRPTPVVRAAWADEAAGLLSSLLVLRDQSAAALLRRGDALCTELQVSDSTEPSDLLPSSLTLRLARLSACLRDAVAALDQGAGDDPWADASALAPVERTWVAVTAHRLAEHDDRTPAFRAAVRLARWLATPAAPSGPDLAALVARHSDVDAWVDAATSDAAGGVVDSELAVGLTGVLAAVRARRAAHDRPFASALAEDSLADRGAVQGLEDLLPHVVLPLVVQHPVLLLVCDGMSAAVAAEVVSSVTGLVGQGWLEVLPGGEVRRGTALALLPSLTEHSRASLLSGRITSGSQDVERSGHQALARAHGSNAVLFHKKQLDETPPGQAVATDVARAVDDLPGAPLVTCVLNTIDDALDRSDPGGTDWGLDTVKHLRPLLERARVAGRVVVLTSDHGHVIERRQGTLRPAAVMSSGRSRSAQPPPADDEVLVQGRRVVGGPAVLAVDETLRYGPLKAGYHGGASPAEVVVPVAVLITGAPPDGWHVAGPQEPAWWWSPLHVPTAAAAPTLFADPLPAASEGDLLAVALVASATFADQKQIAGRVDVKDDQVRGLVAALVQAPGHRLPSPAAALALGEAPARLRGAVAQVRRLLGVEGYEVLGAEPDGSLVLDVRLLREQFGL